jgi:S-DNA-T family DNA segregation ATPase FtsK/SpoIIIE
MLVTPLISWLATPATVIILLVLTFASLLVMFDTHIVPFSFFKRKKRITIGNTNSDKQMATGNNTDANIKINTISDETDSSRVPTKESKKAFSFPGEKSKDTKSQQATKNDDLPIIIKPKSSGDTYTPPPLKILRKNSGKPIVGDVKANVNQIKRTLKNFGIDVEMDEVSIGPTVTRYALKPAEGVRLNKIVSLQSNLELALAASPVRIEAPIPGKALVGIEVPNKSRTTLGLRSFLALPEYAHNNNPLLFTLGSDTSGKAYFIDIAKTPHMLIAGATGTGKSVTVHDIIVSLLYRAGPNKLRLIMVDPKRVELTLYNKIPHLLTPVITNAQKTLKVLKWLTKEMDRRYDVLQDEAVRDISSYHKNILGTAEKKLKEGKIDKDDMPEEMPYIVTFIDELSDLMQAYPRELESSIVRLTQMSRAVGIHLVLATQRPSVQVITGLIKANVPTRIALQVASSIDSRTILDGGGAEKLLGKGDMLYLGGEMSKPVRVQAPYVSEDEVKKVTEYLSKSYESELEDTVDFDSIDDDTTLYESTIGGTSIEDKDAAAFEEAKQIVINDRKASTSYLQRKMRIGYNRAALLMDMLESEGVVAQQNGNKPREILVQKEEGQTNDSSELIDNK